MTVSSIFKVAPTTQSYDWGKIGLEAKVAQFAKESKLPGFQVQEEKPYAELWMGTHPSGPSRLISSDSSSSSTIQALTSTISSLSLSSSAPLLSSHLQSNPELIGEKVLEKFKDEGSKEGNLPFLFKVLSIQKALSIQSHPDKETAVKLHKEQPNVYKDPNHKPEMALALTPFDALCGFRPLHSINHFLSTTPELSALIPPSILSQFKEVASKTEPTPAAQSPNATRDGPKEKKALRDLFAAVMTATDDVWKVQLQNLVERYKSQEIKDFLDSGKTDEDQAVKRWVLKLNEQFPGDIGIFCVFLLNLVTLKPGEAIFLGAGEPHAYLSGECIECMANSDNVIRAGLTPKLRDVPNLISTLTYTSAPPTKQIVHTKRFQSGPAAGVGKISTLYDPPIPEFSVVEVKFTRGTMQWATHKPVEGPSLVIATEGEGSVNWKGEGGKGERLNVGTGDVFFVGAGTELQYVNGAEGDFVLYRAFVEA